MHARPLAVRVALAGLGALAAISPATALASSHPRSLLSRTPSGKAPDGAATDPAMSGDGRIARWASYASTATDIAGGTGQHRNVYLVERKAPYSRRGTPWMAKRTLLASKGLGGAADGDSWGGSFDGYRLDAGDKTYAAKCFAFVSDASNLVEGDRDGVADVFVRTLRTGRLRRIASSKGATAVDLDGRCKRVAFVAGGVLKVAAADGSGRARAISGPGAASPALSVDGTTATFERAGGVWVWQGGRTRRLAGGRQPSSDAWGKRVTYRRGDHLYGASLMGSLAEHEIRARAGGARLTATTAPSVTAAGQFALFGSGSHVDSNVYRRFGACPGSGSTVTAVAASAHGNYAAFTCNSGAAYLSYIGPS